MKKILFLSGFGIFSTYPNPICEVKIINALNNTSEVLIDIACDGIVEKTQILNWKNNPLYTIRRILRWPAYNPNVEIACRKELSQILSNAMYDCIFVPHKPFETVYAACKIKKKYPGIKLFIYALDPIANEIDANNGIGKYLFFLTRYAEKNAFNTADHIFHMECNRKKYSNVKYSKYFDKFSFLDFPLIEHTERAENRTEKYDGSLVKLLYTGALDNTYRSPYYFLEVYNLISKNLSVEFHLYAKGNSIPKIEEMYKQNSSIKSFGYIPKKELERKIEEADYLINIGNKFSSMLPSKILTYFMTGKPIIHIKSQETDSSIQYLEKYGLFLIIYESDPVEKSAKKLMDFIKNNYHKRLSSTYVENKFEHNTPKWNAKQILKVLMNGT